MHPPPVAFPVDPNWTAVPPREAFFRLGLFGIRECKRVASHDYGICGVPEKNGIASRFEQYVDDDNTLPGIALLWDTYRYGIDQHGFDPDDWVYELTCGVIGTQAPSPVYVRTLAEVVIHDFLMQEMCQQKVHYRRTHDLFTTEGGTAAVGYVFDSLVNNHLLRQGDTIAIGVPAFAPFLELPALDRYRFHVVYIHGSERDTSGNATFQYATTEIDKLKDPSVKCFFVTNPSNPMSVAIDRLGLHYLSEMVRRYNPGLMIITDDGYGPFVPAFHSLLRELPHHTLCIYSFSKYFGATGWRLGVVALHKENVFDRNLAELPPHLREEADRRYGGLPASGGTFIGRLAADSRPAVQGYLAGLSLPQQIQMMLFAAFALLDRENKYKRMCMNRVRTRYNLFHKGLRLPVLPDPNRAAYYSEFNVLDWARRHHGKGFTDFLTSRFDPADIVARLSEEKGIVLPVGGRMAAPEWSVLLSMAHFDNDDYEAIGQTLLRILEEYVSMWRNVKK